MSKRYTLVLADGFEDTFARKDAALRAGDKSGQGYHVLSPAGLLVHTHDLQTEAIAEDINADFDAMVAREEAPEAEEPEDDEDLIGEPVEQPVPSDLVEASRTFPGNYSISMIPFAQSIADGFGGLETSSEKTAGLARVFTVRGPAERVEAFLAILDEASTQVLVDLRAWQKENIEARRGLTDMQKYLQHRSFIEDFGAKVGKRLAETNR